MLWLETHADKHQAIIQKLLKKKYEKNQIIEYFLYDNLSQNEPEFCPLFTQNKKCHNIEELNCFFCGCPHFRFYSNPHTKIYSYCDINSIDGEQKCYNNSLHQDCSDCSTPHKNQYILQNYTLNWYDKMKVCKKET